MNNNLWQKLVIDVHIYYLSPMASGVVNSCFCGTCFISTDSLKFMKALQLHFGNKKQDKLIVYIITNPEFAEKYGKYNYFIKHKRNDDR